MSNNYNDFNQALAAGKLGEAAIKQLLSSSGIEVEEKTNDKDFQVIDVDFVIKNSTTSLLLEVKTDYRMFNTKNICLETVSNLSKDRFKKGWFATSNADWVAFYSPQAKGTIFVKLEEIRDYYKNNEREFRHFTTHQNECGKFYKEGQIAIISIQKLKDNCKSFKYIKNNNNVGFLFE